MAARQPLRLEGSGTPGGGSAEIGRLTHYPSSNLVQQQNRWRLSIALTKGTRYRTIIAPIKEELMQTLTASQARSSLYRLIDQTALNHEPVVITGKRNNAVLISTEDWASIQETMYLLSVPGMRKSIMEGLQTPVGECDKELEW